MKILSNATIIRVDKNTNYTVVNNQMYQSRNMSLKARGLLGTILSLPPTWEYSIKGLAAVCKESPDTIGATMKELRELGFVEMIKHKPSVENGGRYRTEYIVHETSITPDKLDLIQKWKNNGL